MNYTIHRRDLYSRLDSRAADRRAIDESESRGGGSPTADIVRAVPRDPLSADAPHQYLIDSRARPIRRRSADQSASSKSRALRLTGHRTMDCIRITSHSSADNNAEFADCEFH